MILIKRDTVDFETNALRKKVNEVQKEISAKKKVGWFLFLMNL